MMRQGNSWNVSIANSHYCYRGL